jgi:hypothetical protein
MRRGISKETRGTAYVVYEDIYDAKTAVDHLSGFNVANRYLIVLYYNATRQTKKVCSNPTDMCYQIPFILACTCKKCWVLKRVTPSTCLYYAIMNMGLVQKKLDHRCILGVMKWRILPCSLGNSCLPCSAEWQVSSSCLRKCLKGHLVPHERLEAVYALTWAESSHDTLLLLQ